MNVSPNVSQTQKKSPIESYKRENQLNPNKFENIKFNVQLVNNLKLLTTNPALNRIVHKYLEYIERLKLF